MVIGLGALIAWLLMRAPARASVAEQVFDAPDMRTVSGAVPTGGTTTVVYSHDTNAAVLVINNVVPPGPGTVYQMWLIGENSTRSAGTMDAKAVAPSATAVLSDIDNSNSLVFTVEPGSGSTRPTGQLIAELPLT